MMENLYANRIMNTNTVFDDYFLDVKVLYLSLFNVLPSLIYISQVDGEKACQTVTEKYRHQVKQVYEYRWYNKESGQQDFETTVVVMDNNCLLEFGQNYCEVLYDGQLPEFVQEVSLLVNKFKPRQRREPMEINLIVKGRAGLELRAMEIKRTKLDLALFYENDFIETDALISKRLKRSNDKGIILLHGLPGTGKTTYLRYLIGKIRKKIMFLSPSLAGDLMNPDLMKLLINNPGSVLIIEDAENIIVDRMQNSASSVSDLLNISDGLLADFLNVQVICTFNSLLTTADSALLRKGRLIARYEFGKLGVLKAQRLSDHLGFKNTIIRPMTLAEISNQHEKEQKEKRTDVIGFRREPVMQN